MNEPKKGMDNMTKGFLIFLAVFFVITTLLIVFSGHGYELKGASKNPASATTAQNQAGNSSTGSGNIDFQPYMEEMHKQISGEWQPPAVNKDSETILEFTILKNGYVKDEKVFQSSGIKEVDDSAITALKKASPLPPLPLSYPKDSITVKFNFTVRANQD